MPEFTVEDVTEHMNQSDGHPFFLYSENEEETLDDIAAAGYYLAEEGGYPHENGCEPLNEMIKELPDGRFQVGVVVSADRHEDWDLGMIWVGRLHEATEKTENKRVFEIDSVSYQMISWNKEAKSYDWPER